MITPAYSITINSVTPHPETTEIFVDYEIKLSQINSVVTGILTLDQEEQETLNKDYQNLESYVLDVVETAISTIYYEV